MVVRPEEMARIAVSNLLDINERSTCVALILFGGVEFLARAADDQRTPASCAAASRSAESHLRVARSSCLGNVPLSNSCMIRSVFDA